MHANNEIGTIQPIEEIAKIAKKQNIPFHSDAVQSYTKIDIDTQKIPITLMSFSAHKIHGPKGIGVLYIRKGTELKPLSNGGAHEYGIRPGTENVPGIVGFAKATQIKKDLEYIKQLRDYLTKGLLAIPNTKLNGHPTKRLVNNINISFKFVEGESILYHLNDKGIAVSTGSACSSHSLDPSHVLTSIGLPLELAHGAIRFTLSKFNTKEEMDYTIESVREVIKKLRAMSPIKED
jgi:cysteine desulfurase